MPCVFIIIIMQESQQRLTIEPPWRKAVDINLIRKDSVEAHVWNFKKWIVLQIAGEFGGEGFVGAFGAQLINVAAIFNFCSCVNVTYLIRIHDKTCFNFDAFVCKLFNSFQIAQSGHETIDVDLESSVEVCANLVEHLGQIYIVKHGDIVAIVVLGRVAEFVSSVNHLHSFEILL